MVEKSVGEFIVGWVVRCDWVFLPTIIAGEGEEVSYDVEFPLQVL